MTTTFRLGRPRLAEDSGLTSQQLLKQPNTLARRYEAEGKPHEVTATLVMLERVDGGGDMWALELLAVLEPARRQVTAGVLRPMKLLRQLGKLGLEQDFSVNAGFWRPAEHLVGAKVPAALPPDALGGAFSHVVGYTLAKVGELKSVLYEVSVRDAGQFIRLDVAFTYKRALDEHVFDAALQRATQLVDVVAPPRTAPVATQASAEGATP